MGHLLLLLVVALVAAALVFGVTVLIMGGDQGMDPAEPDGRAVPLPGARPLSESDLGELRFDVAFRGYRMAQVDQAMRRAAYDVGYKDELIGVLEAEVEALRDGRLEDADRLREARDRAAGSAAEERMRDAPNEALIDLTPAEPRADLPPLPSPAPIQAVPPTAASTATADAAKADAAKAGTAKAGTATADAATADPGKAGTARMDAGKADAGKAGTAEADVAGEIDDVADADDADDADPEGAGKHDHDRVESTK